MASSHLPGEGISPAKTSPAYLKSNATSHTSVFSAIAELIDNAYDPCVGATELDIAYELINEIETLQFTDNGVGMDSDQLMKMLSFGFSDKVEINGIKPVGKYGNGFKSGSMKLGQDAIVFTKCEKTMSVGLLSQTYLEAIQADTVLVPIVSWDRKSQKLLNGNKNVEKNLEAILEHSIFTMEAQLLRQFSQFPNDSRFPNGTQIFIWNLAKDVDTGRTEIDFEKKPDDFTNRMALENDPDIKKSLRSYARILYLKPRMKIFLRGKKVNPILITKSLSRTETDSYSPHFLKQANQSIPITFGFQPNCRGEEQENYGALIYHNNRLIVAYKKLGYQRYASGKGKGVVCVLEADFLVTNHNKQGFAQDEKYTTIMSALNKKLNEYWDSMQGETVYAPGVVLTPDDHWVVCEDCNKWRRLGKNMDISKLPDKWYCHMNENKKFNSCDVPEEKLAANEVNYQTQTPYRLRVNEAKKEARRTRDSQTAAAVVVTEPSAKPRAKVQRVIKPGVVDQVEAEPAGDPNISADRSVVASPPAVSRPLPVQNQTPVRRRSSRQEIPQEENENVNVAVGGDEEVLTPRQRRAQRARDRLAENKLNAMEAEKKRKATEVRVVKDAIQQLLDETDKYLAGKNSQQQAVQPWEQSAAGPSVTKIADGNDPSPFGKRIKLEPGVSPTVQEDDDDIQFIENSHEEDEEMDSDDDITMLMSNVITLKSHWSDLTSQMGVKNEAVEEAKRADVEVQTNLVGEVVSAKPEQVDQVTESQSPMVPTGSSSAAAIAAVEEMLMAARMEVDDGDEDLVIKRQPADHSACEEQFSSLKTNFQKFQALVARAINVLLPQVPILAQPEELETLKSKLVKICVVNPQPPKSEPQN